MAAKVSPLGPNTIATLRALGDGMMGDAGALQDAGEELYTAWTTQSVRRALALVEGMAANVGAAERELRETLRKFGETE